ncbi:MAG TPA: GlsB/YeaQ/YmgE family stress response membrane protein [Candidatus Limnocylindria bacterium]|nr:GlsB/YeaQ/YmgE family stress response membrane protein [Candidatus Limnocylindria bacterium]
MPEGLNPFVWILIGLIAGAMAGWFVPGRERMGCIGTTVVGIIGGLLGGWIWTGLLDQDAAGGILGAIVLASLGAALVLLVLRAMGSRG